VASLLRLCGHGEHDDASYVDPKLRSSRMGRDCLKVAEQRMLEEGWCDSAAAEGWREEAVRQVEEALAEVQREPAPDPYKETWCALANRHFCEGCMEPSCPICSAA
jgi:pyruvate dehydrogenase E1 component alpha subunit/2-oxoisovalerate dehydrogenase E1 component alpha subunit